jgi:hypothetical protein
MNPTLGSIIALAIGAIGVALLIWGLAPLYRQDCYRCPSCGRFHRPGDSIDALHPERPWVVGTRLCPRCLGHRPPRSTPKLQPYS